jgi:hypothetical protein
MEEEEGDTVLYLLYFTFIHSFFLLNMARAAPLGILYCQGGASFLRLLRVKVKWQSNLAVLAYCCNYELQRWIHNLPTFY